jgi:hypothetical protein
MMPGRPMDILVYTPLEFEEMKERAFCLPGARSIFD